MQTEEINGSVQPTPTRRDFSRQNPAFGVIAILSAALLNSMGSVLSKVLLEKFSVSQLTLARTVVTFVILFCILLLTTRHRPVLTQQDILNFTAYGLVGMVVSPFIFFGAIERISIGVVLILEYSAPVMVLLYLRLVRGIPVARPVAIAMSICIAGLACVALSGGTLIVNTTGVLLGFGAAVALASLYLLAERSLAGQPALFVSTFGYFVGSIIWIFLAPAWSFPFEELWNPIQVPLNDAMQIPLNGFWAIMTIGSAFSILPSLLMLSGIRNLGPARASSLSISEPVISSAIAWLVLGQILTPIQIMGGMVTILGLLALERARRSSRFF